MSDFFLSGQKDSKTEYDNCNTTDNGFPIKGKDSQNSSVNIVQRRRKNIVEDGLVGNTDNDLCEKDDIKANWKKIFLLIVAITVHNIPGTA